MSITEWYKQSGSWVQIGSQVAPPPPPPPEGIIYGSHIGIAGTISNLISELDVHIVRTYSTASVTAGQTTWSQVKASQVPVSRGASHTFKPNIDHFQKGNANYNSAVQKFRGILEGAPLNQLIWIGVFHEPWDEMVEGDGTSFTLNEWRNLQINFKADVIDYINTFRGSNPIIFNGCLHGDSWGAHKINNQWSAYELYNADVRDALDEFSFDSYNPGYWDNIDQWMQQYLGNKRYGCWETGWYAGGSPGTDQEVFDHMKNFVEVIYPSMTIKPSYVCWFNSTAEWGNGITGGNNVPATNYWKALCTSSPPATPASYFA